MENIEFHPLANLFPMIDAEGAAQLAADIGERGLEMPIVLYEGQILDGRNRYAACQSIGYSPTFAAYKGDDPLGFVVSTNLQRRHLTESQRAIVAAGLVSLSNGMRKVLNPGAVTQREAAAKLSISERALRAAKSVRDAGATALVEAIRDGHVTVHQADALKRLSNPEVVRILKAGDRAVMNEAKRLRTEDKAEKRAVKLSLISAIAGAGRARTLPGRLPRKCFPVIYADPPWKAEGVWNDANGQDKGYPYPTMALPDICALCAGDASPATDDAVLFLWRTANRAREALTVMEAWGFEFVTEIVWDKVHRGTGFWVIDCHEVLMIGKRGKFPCFLPGTQPLSLYREAKGEHSAKPAYFRDMIDRLLPGVPKLEMFSRHASEGDWTVWGFEAQPPLPDGEQRP